MNLENRSTFPFAQFFTQVVEFFKMALSFQPQLSKQYRPIWDGVIACTACVIDIG